MVTKGGWVCKAPIYNKNIITLIYLKGLLQEQTENVCKGLGA